VTPVTGPYWEETFASAGEVSVNPGGEPERDESGLPPVDIEIPDDARELDRDVQAYYREQRALRRQRHGLHMRGSLAKDGVVLPLLACCLILALITGTLLTVFTATSDPTLTGLPSGRATARPATGSSTPTGPSSAAASSPAPRAPTVDVVPGVLPDTTITVADRAPIRVLVLRQAALVLIPAQCNCNAAVSWLVKVVSGAHARPYLIYTAATKAAVTQVYDHLGSSERDQTFLALTPDNALSTSVPERPADSDLTAIVLGLTKTKVGYASSLRPGDNPTNLIHALTR
jgi:hypothetical protein